MFDVDCTGAGRGELRVIFTQIDQGKPEREFFFGVHMQDDDIYEGGQDALAEWLSKPHSEPLAAACIWKVPLCQSLQRH